MAAKIKQAAKAHPIPNGKEQVSEFIALIGEAQRERERIQADMNDELAAVKARFEELAAPYKEDIEALGKGVQLWCEANRADLTKGKIKHYVFPAGQVAWRMRPPRVVVRAVENVIDACIKLGLGKFLREKVEINKEAMLAEPDLAQTLTGVSIAQGEDFVITPFETKLEEVA
jgi:phage host-nuclease inhibitor protein Gam